MFTFRLSSWWERSRLSVNSLGPTTHVCWLRNNPYIESMKASVAVLMPRTCSLWGYGNCCGISVITDKWLPRLKNFYLMMWDCIQITSVSDWAGLVVWLLWNKGLFSWKNLSVAKEHLRSGSQRHHEMLLSIKMKELLPSQQIVWHENLDAYYPTKRPLTNRYALLLFNFFPLMWRDKHCFHSKH